MNAWQTPPSTQDRGRSSSQGHTDVPHRLSKIRQSVAGNIANNLRASNSADGRIHEPAEQNRSVTRTRSVNTHVNYLISKFLLCL